MIERKRVDAKIFIVENPASVAAWKFLNRQFERELEIGRPKRGIEKCAKTLGSENIQRCFASIQMKCAQQAGNAVEMISVEMTDEDGMDAASLYSRSHQLELGALAAVE